MTVNKSCFLREEKSVSTKLSGSCYQCKPIRAIQKADLARDFLCVLSHSVIPGLGGLWLFAFSSSSSSLVRERDLNCVCVCQREKRRAKKNVDDYLQMKGRKYVGAREILEISNDLTLFHNACLYDWHSWHTRSHGKHNWFLATPLKWQK